MAEAVQLPALSEAQKQSWHALMDLYEQVNSNWTLIGGQLVHLHCAERGVFPTRPTNDVDTVVNIRASPTILSTFTGALKDLGCTADISGDGIQHRWRRDLAQIDVLIPEGVGERAAATTGAGAPRPSPRPAPLRPSTVASPSLYWLRTEPARCCALTSSEPLWQRQLPEPRLPRTGPSRVTAPTSSCWPASYRLATSGRLNW